MWVEVKVRVGERDEWVEKCKGERMVVTHAIYCIGTMLL